MTERRVLLHEEILLLALSDRDGVVKIGSWYAQAVGGAVVAELLLAGRARVAAEGKKHRLQIVSREPLGDPLADEWLELIAADEKQRKLATWVSRIANTRKLKHRVAMGLVQKGVLKAAEESLLLVFKRKVYPEIDPAPERDARERLRAAVLGDAPEVDVRTVALLSLAKAVDLLPVVFAKKELKAHKRRIADLVSGELAGEAVRETVEAIHAVIVTAAIMPAVIS